MLADEKGEILRFLELEMGIERGVQPIECLVPFSSAHKTADPFIGGRVFRQPGVRRGEDQLSARICETRQLREEAPGFLQAINEIGGEHYVEGTQFSRQILRVSVQKFHAITG